MTNDAKVVSSFVGSRLLEGYIGLQNHDDKSNVSFKNIKVKEVFEIKS
jgi:hypothetical protein